MIINLLLDIFLFLNHCKYKKNYLIDGNIPGHAYQDYDAVAIECQHAPDSPNHPEYPSTVLRPGEVFEEAIIFAFDA